MVAEAEVNDGVPKRGCGGCAGIAGSRTGRVRARTRDVSLLRHGVFRNMRDFKG